MRDGWKKVKVADLVEPLTTVNPKKTPDKSFLYIDVSSVSRTTFTVDNVSTIIGSKAPSRARRLVKAGDIIFATIRPTLLRVAEIPQELDCAICSTGFFVLRPKKGVLGRFLFYSLLTKPFSDEMELLQRGASYPAVSDSDVKNHIIDLPPLVEQKRIVAILDEAFSGIEKVVANTEKNLVNAHELFYSYLNLVFSQQEKGWHSIQLNEIGKIQTGSTPKTSDKENYGNTIAFIKPGDFRPDGTICCRNKGLSIKGMEKARLVKAGSVLMVCIGATIGKTGFVTKDVVTNQQINSLTPSDCYFPKFIYYQMLTDKFQESVITQAGQTTLPIINKGKWSKLKLTIPPSVEHQQKIVSQLDAISFESRQLESIYQQKLTALTELKQSLLQKAFSGELTAEPQAQIKEAAA